MSRIYSRIIGTGICLPEKILTNEELSCDISFTAEEIEKRTGGIVERRVANPEETNISMGGIAFKNALEDAFGDVARDYGKMHSLVDFILVATNTNKENFPSAASRIQQVLGKESKVPFKDCQAGCTSFNYELEAADYYIRSGEYNTVAVIGTDTLSKIVKKNNKNRMLFGDGAGCVILQASQEPGLINHYTGGQGHKADLIKMVDGFFEMDGRQVFKDAAEILPCCCLEVVRREGCPWNDIEWIAPHQANGKILDYAVHKLAQELKVDKREIERKFLRNIEKYGNTSSASVPILLHESIKNGKIKKGSLGILVGFGAGLTYCANLIRM